MTIKEALSPIQSVPQKAIILCIYLYRSGNVLVFDEVVLAFPHTTLYRQKTADILSQHEAYGNLAVDGNTTLYYLSPPKQSLLMY